MTNVQAEQLAYRLWENDGRPDGRADEFWFLAEFLLAAPGANAAPPAAPTIPVPDQNHPNAG